MKKTIAIIAAVVIVIAAGVGIYFGLLAYKDNPTDLTVTEDSLQLNEGTIEVYLKTPERYRAALVSSYGLGEKRTEEFFAEPENWLAYDLILNLKNESDRDLTVVGFKTNIKGGDVFISSNIGGELTLTPGAVYPISTSILINNGDLTLEQAKEMIDKNDFEIIYGTKTSEDADLSETMLAPVAKG